MSYWSAIGQHFAKILLALFVICGILTYKNKIFDSFLLIIDSTMSELKNNLYNAVGDNILFTY